VILGRTVAQSPTWHGRDHKGARIANPICSDGGTAHARFNA
jgi:hypothetical protein